MQIQKEVAAWKAKYAASSITTLLKPDALAVRQQLGSSGMFADETQLTIIEGMLEKGVSEAFIAFLGSVVNDATVVFVSYTRLDRAEGAGTGRGRKKEQADTVLKGKKLLDTIKKQIPTARIVACNDYAIFDFLDTLAPKSSKKSIAAYEALLRSEYEAEQIFALLVDHVRNLLLAKDGGEAALGGMHDFRKSKLQKQASLFSSAKLAQIYEKLFEVEVAQKQKRQGLGSPFSMVDDLRFLLAHLFY